MKRRLLKLAVASFLTPAVVAVVWTVHDDWRTWIAPIVFD